LKRTDDLQKALAAANDFLSKENSGLDKYDIITKKVWLTIGKPEPQAGEFAKCLKHLADSFTGADWKILYKLN
jgi:hypothetical protein